MNIGEKLYHFRKIRKLTQNELAKDICSVSYLSKIENNVVLPDHEIIRLLYKKLDISFKEISSGDLLTIKKRLYEWYEMIKSKDIEKAQEEEAEINKFISSIEEPSIIVDSQLLLSRYFVLVNNLKEAENCINRIKTLESRLTKEQKYYYYIFYAFFKFSKNDLIKSLQSCILAEEIDKELNINEIELYYLLALTHSRLHHIISAINYGNITLQKAIEKLDYFINIETRIILAINYVRIYNFEKAYLYLRKSLQIAIELDNRYLIGNIKHGLGYHYSKKKEPKNAITYYLGSLNNKDKTTDSYLMTLYSLAKEYITINNFEKASGIIDEGIKLADDINSEMNLIKFNVLKYQINTQTLNYQKYLEETTIPYFTKQNNWYEVSQYAESLANYYSEESKYKKACYFHKLAHESLKRTMI